MTSNYAEVPPSLFEEMAEIGAEAGESIAEREQSGEFHRAAWKRYADIGVHGLLIAPRHGGSGRTPIEYARIAEELGAGCLDSGLLMALGAHVLAVEVPIQEFGDERQRAAYLPALVSGQSVGANAMTEPGTGSDALALTTTARRAGDGYILNGHKHCVTNAPDADVFVVYATVDPALGFTGVTAFLVERGDLGVTVSRGPEKTGLRTATWGDVVFEDCPIPASRRLGAEKQGSAIFARTMAWERALILAPWLGVMRREIDECVRHARGRRQFGRHIGHFQSVAHRLVDMRARLEISRMVTHRAAEELGAPDPGILPELGKLYTSEAAVETFTNALQIYGALGYTRTGRVDRNLRDALGMTISSGTSDMQRNIIAGRMGLTWPEHRS